MKTRIIESIIKHSGNDLPCYIPQVNKDGVWTNILSDGSYILKESYNPLDKCKKCDGQGCGECKGIGFRKGTPVDLKYIAEMFIKNTTK